MRLYLMLVMLNFMPQDAVRLTETISKPVNVSAGWQKGWFAVVADEKLLQFRPEILDDGTATIHRKISSTPGYIFEMSLQPNGERLLTHQSGEKGTIVWSENWTQVFAIDGGAYKPETRRLSLSEDGNRVVLARRSFDHEGTEIWDLHLVDLVLKTNKTLNLGNQSHGVVGMGLSPDGKLAVVAHHQGQIDFVSIPELNLLHQLHTKDHLCTSVEFTSDGRYVGLLNMTDFVMLNCESGMEFVRWSANKTDADRNYLYSFDFSPTGESVYIGIADFPANKTFHISRLPVADLSVMNHSPPLKGISHSPQFELQSVDASPDDEWIATVASTPAATEISFSRVAAFESIIRFPLPEDSTSDRESDLGSVKPSNTDEH